MAPTLALALLSLVSFVVVRSLQKKRDTKGLPLPPGPPPLPFVGNVLGVNPDHPWLAYSRWGTEYGELVYTRLFSQDIIIINSERVAHDLLDRRSHNYSTRPPGVIRVLDFLSFGVEFSSIFLPYSDRWRLHRRIFHQAFRLEAAPSFRPIQMRNAHNLILNLLAYPEVYGTHFHTFSTSVIMSITYDYSTAALDDPFIALVERSLEISVRELRPEVAAVVGEFPILEKLPSWFPGASFVRGAILQRSLVPLIVQTPFEHVKKNMANKAKDEEEVAMLEKAVKEASASGYAAASETTTSTLHVFLLAMVLYPDVQARIAHATSDDDVYEGYYIPKGLWRAIQRNILTRRGSYPSVTCQKQPPESRPTNRRDDISFAFGFGRRVCVGRYVADASLFAAIVNILAVFRVERVPGWNVGP
ncbi:cytochrome P450 [Suillus variegatus]|nr:cytochrome P450 [Suillus variegatus]